MKASRQSASQTTQDIIAAGNAPFHLRPEIGDRRRDYADDFSNPWVSSRSRWRDDRWYLDNPTPGQTPSSSTINWCRQLADGSLLTNPRHWALLDAFRRFIWSLLVDPRNGRGLATGTMSALSTGVHLLAWWMLKNGYRHFGQLDPAASEEFVADLRNLIREVRQTGTINSEPEQAEVLDEEGSLEEDNPAREDLAELGLSQAYTAIRIWHRLWGQASVLTEAGVPTLPEVPFGGASTWKVARDLADREKGQIPWLPDEVAAPIMAAAYRLIGAPADDVIKLQDLYLSARAKIRHAGDVRGKLNARSVIEAYQFAVLPGENAPWHTPLLEITEETLRQDAANQKPAQRLRGVIRPIRDAAVIVVQSSAGLRINEICGLSAGMNPETGLPACIVVRPSQSGLSELFYLRGTLSKTRPTPIEVEWLVGCRPAGDAWIPPPVRAIEVLQQLFTPWRQMADAEPAVRASLLVSFTTPAGLPGSGIRNGRMSGERLLMGQKDFVRRFVDLSGLPNTNARGEDLAEYRDTRGTSIVTHQWRKTYARYLFRINNALLPAIAQQFKHLSIAKTERAYIGNDLTMLQDIDAVLVQQSVDFWAQFGPNQKARVAGRMGAIIARYRPEIMKIVEGQSQEEAREALKAWVLRYDLRIFHNADGKCLIRLNPIAARCHEVAGTSHWANRDPAYASRDTSTCLGCSLFAIDGEHAEYWVRRYVTNQKAWLAAKATGDTRGYRVVRKRADQGKAVLVILNVPIPEVAIPDAP